MRQFPAIKSWSGTSFVVVTWAGPVPDSWGDMGCGLFPSQGLGYEASKGHGVVACTVVFSDVLVNEVG